MFLGGNRASRGYCLIYLREDSYGKHLLFFLLKPAAAYVQLFTIISINLKKNKMTDSTKTTGFVTQVATTTKTNTNGNLFRNCTVSIDDQLFQAIIWEKSYANGIVIGDEYTCELKPGLDRDGKARLFITVLNGTDALVPTMDHFAALFANLAV